MNTVNEMTNTELLSAISRLLDKRFAEQEERLDKRFAEQEECLDKKFTERLDKRLAEQERYLMNFILEEVDRVQEKANDHFKRLEKRLDNIELTIRTRRSDLECRVAALEQKLSC